MALAVVAGGVNEARAGHWEMQLVSSRSGEKTSWDNGQHKMVTSILNGYSQRVSEWTSGRIDTFGPTPFMEYNYWAAEGREAKHASAAQRFSRTINLLWKPSPYGPRTDDPPPKAVSLLLNGVVGVEALPADDAVHALSNGLGGAVTEHPLSSNDGRSRKVWKSDSTLRINIANPEGADRLTFGPVQLSASGSNWANVVEDCSYYGTCRIIEDHGSFLTTYSDFGAEVQPRSVAISSSIDQSYRKSTSPPAPVIVNGQPQPTPAPDPLSDPPAWRVRVKRQDPKHSVAYWADDGTVDNMTPHWYGSGTFTAYTERFTNPTYAWTVPGIAGTRPPDFLTRQSFTLVSSSDPYVDPIPFPRIELSTDPIGPNLPSTAITVVATDAQGSLDDTYTVQWHVQYENFQIIREKKDNHRVVWHPNNYSGGNVAPGFNAIASFKHTWRREFGDWLAFVGSGLQLISAFPRFAGPGGILLNGLGFVASDQAQEIKEENQLGVPHGTAWAGSVVLTSNFGMTGLVPPNKTPEQCNMTEPLLVDVYDDLFKKCDQYDGNGYKATVNKMKRTPSGIMKPAGVFQVITTTASSTPPTTPPASSAEPSRDEVGPEPTRSGKTI